MQCRIHKRHGWIPGLGRCPGERNSNPAFLPGESHGQRNLMGYSPWGCRAGHDWSDLAHKHTRYEKSSLFSPHLPKSSVQFSSVAQSCPTLCNPMDCSTPGLPVHHQLPEFTQTHVYWVGDAIQLSHPLLSPSPPTFNLSQYQGFVFFFVCFFPVNQFFTSGGQIIRISVSTSVLPVNIQDWFPLGWTGWISLQSKGLSRVFSNTTVQKHQFFGAQLSL